MIFQQHKLGAVKLARSRINGYCLMLAALSFLGTGCGGLHASHSVSPLDFLLPGAGHLLHVKTEPQTDLAATNTLIIARDAALGNSGTPNASP